MRKDYDVVLISGGFDPVHKGHVRMVKSSAKLGEILVVGVNSDEWLKRKKGKAFMGFEERVEIMSSFQGVGYATGFDDSDNSASDLIHAARKCYPDASIAFANGGDRVHDNIPEVQTCLDNRVEMVWNVGGGKIQSSSDLISRSKTKD